ncbi:MAG: hypothetical protein FWD32_00395 [Firmicutes bacterium]|nr:hypothetical protein [Bacillota bacterium]
MVKSTVLRTSSYFIAFVTFLALFIAGAFPRTFADICLDLGAKEAASFYFYKDYTGSQVFSSLYLATVYNTDVSKTIKLTKELQEHKDYNTLIHEDENDRLTAICYLAFVQSNQKEQGLNYVRLRLGGSGFTQYNLTLLVVGNQL